MATSIEPAHSYSNTGPSLADYTSMMLQMYFEALDQSSMAQVLDVGPVCEENITFFAQRVKRFHVCDMFLRLNRNRREGLPPKKVWKHLDYAPHRFDGINLWDFIDHINDDEIGKPTYVETDTCHLSNYESENMTELKELVEKLSSTPEGPAPRFKLESNEI